ncbi:MAG: hypothetical protein U9N32_09960, partial [Spirochaetota bacterium]|nr:hypothetical protein [Spirochaetota bacterium]
MRCIKCDKRVVRYIGYKWKSECDYLFFRNFVTNPEKLEEGLMRDNSFSAYACQCDWRSMSETVNLGENPA